jgi:glycosyltransferase 2 family protein
VSRRAVVVGAVLGFPVSLALLMLSLQHLDGAKLKASLGGANVGVLMLSVGVMAIVYLIQADRWRVIAAAPGVPLVRFAEWVVGAVAVNNVLPGRAGDILRSEWLARGAGKPRTSAVSSVVVDRGFDVVTLVAMLGLTYPFVPHPRWLNDFWIVGGSLGVVVSIVFIAAAAYARGGRASAARGMRARLADVAHGAGSVLRGRLVLRIAARSALAWTAWASSAWLVASSLGIALTPLEVLFVTAVLNLGVAIPSSPGFIGTYQWLGVAALGNLGVGHADAFAFSVLMHAVWYLPTTFAGVVLALRKVPPAVAGALATKDFRVPRARAARRGSAPPGLTGSVSPTPPARDR